MSMCPLCHGKGLIARPYLDRHTGRILFGKQNCPHCRPTIDVPNWIIVVGLTFVFLVLHIAGAL